MVEAAKEKKKEERTTEEGKKGHKKLEQKIVLNEAEKTEQLDERTVPCFSGHTYTYVRSRIETQ